MYHNEPPQYFMIKKKSMNSPTYSSLAILKQLNFPLLPETFSISNHHQIACDVISRPCTNLQSSLKS